MGPMNLTPPSDPRLAPVSVVSWEDEWDSMGPVEDAPATPPAPRF